MFPLNLPNLLTVLRIMLVPVVVVALLGNTTAASRGRAGRSRPSAS
jgi:phosphatidylglycerophosphate synthase